MAGLGGTGLWGWSQLNQPDALIQRIQLSVMPLPQSLESGELAKLDVKDKALLAQDRTIAASQMQLEQLNKLPARWPLEQGYRQLRQLDALWPDNPQVRALNAQWRKQRELSALSAEALNGYAQAQSQLQRLSAQLDALDERKEISDRFGTKNGGVRHPAVVKGAAAGRTASATGRAKTDRRGFANAVDAN